MVTVSGQPDNSVALSLVLCRRDLDLECESMVDCSLILVLVVRFQEVIHQLDIIFGRSIELMCKLLVFDHLLC